FPMETRAMAIAFFYAVGTAAGGITGPLLFGKLVETKDAGQVFWGYILGAALMIAAGIVQAVIGVEAARKDLEDIAKPLSAEAAEDADEPSARSEREREPRFERPRRPARGERFGPSTAGMSYSPVQQSSSHVPDEDVDEEVDALVAAVESAGPEGIDRRALGERVNCRLWGPGRFRHALAEAQRRGAIRPATRGRYVAGQSVASGR
ncbi:MAG: hypothetical protein QOD44_936, partial [Solirubrobacteraceae bacterium]|nr:hypothetical protein [Solirubrobacteraceae bacterium]